MLLPGHTASPHLLPGAAATPLPSRPAAELLTQARKTLAEAAGQSCPADRYAIAHLAALRAAAAVLASHAQPAGSPARRRPTSAWVLITSISPELGEWAAFFAAGAGKRAAAEAGLPRAVSGREADDLLRDAGTFLSLAEEALGVAAQAALPLRSTG
jgi:hypothetical protein